MSTTDLLRAGETLTTEFKTHLNDRDLTKAIACLANAAGGTLLLGVDDGGRVVGAQPRPGGHMDPVRVASYVQNSTDPPLGVEVRLETIDGQPVFESMCLWRYLVPSPPRTGSTPSESSTPSATPSACPCLRKRSSAWE